jgi:two-component system cell cycle sensor histidine kinase/response regulator CckA
VSGVLGKTDPEGTAPHLVLPDLTLSEAQSFRAMVETLDDYVLRIDADDRVLYVNRLLPDLEGRSVLGTDVLELIPPERRPRWRTLYNRVRQGGQSELVEYQRMDRGKTRYLETRVISVAAAGGADGELLILTRDISDRYRSEEAAWERERYVRTVLNHTLDIVSVVDEQWRRLFVTPVVTAVLGYSMEEWLSLHPSSFIHPEDRAAVMHESERLSARECRTARREARIRHKNGDYLHMDLFAVDLRDDPVSGGFLIVYRDVSERKRIETALRESRQVLEDAQTVAKIGSWVSNEQTGALEWSAETYRIFGIDPGETMSLDRFFGMIHPDDLEEVKRAGTDPDNPYNMVHRIVRPDRTIRFVHERARAEYDANGRRLRMVGTVQDVTEQKRTEDELRHAQKMEAVGRLAGGVAHDFNNLLALILAQCEWIQRELGAEHPLQQELHEIAGASQRGATLTRQLLAFSRRQWSAARVLRLDSVVVETERMLRRLLGEHLVIDVELRSGGAAVLADRGQLEQVLINLAVNARDAMPRGGRLFIATQTIDVETVRRLPTGELAPGRYVVLSVRDEGHGIDEHTMNRLFEPFFTTKPIGEGTGLGLSAVFGIVQQAGGGVSVETTLNRGTTFQVLLPCVGKVTSAEVERERHDEIPRGTETILVVEDDASLRSVISRILGSLGYKVLVAGSGDEALTVSHASHRPIHAVLADLLMPGYDGRTAVLKLRDRRPELKAMYMSGYAEPEVFTRADGAVGDVDDAPILSKPFTARELATTLRNLLDRL